MFDGSMIASLSRFLTLSTSGKFPARAKLHQIIREYSTSQRGNPSFLLYRRPSLQCCCRIAASLTTTTTTTLTPFSTFTSARLFSKIVSKMTASDCKGEEELHRILASLSIDLPTIEHEEKHTVEEANMELQRFETPCIGTKNLFLKSKKGDLVLVTALCTTGTGMSRIEVAAGTKDLRFASAEVLAENLGVVKGSVTPFALVNNVEKKNIIVLLDKNMQDSSTPFVLHPCRNDKSCLVTFPQLEAVLQKLEYAYKVVDFDAVGEKHTDAAAPAPKAKPKPAAPKANAKSAAPKTGPSATAAAAAAPQQSGETKLGIATRREDNFSAWYTDVILKAEMIEYYDVSGCYIIRPWGYYVWKCVQKFLGGRIESMGVEDAYFPMFVSKSCLEREKDHIEGFAPEVAWVTKAGDTDLEMPLAIRPTSETVIYPYYAKWIRSHRDLPVRLNMWNNVIRWEFSHPTPFIRTREFLWQEGHCAWAKAEDNEKEVLRVLEHYAAVYEELLAVPVVRGKKTEKEKFAGGYYTTTVETYIEAVGRGCQGATSHNLGQNFGKMFNISFQDPENNEKTLIPWQNSWGLTTRVIGVMIMVHGDNRGMVMPPRVASTQVIIIPVGITKDTTDEERTTLLDSCTALEEQLAEGGVRAKCDLRSNYSPGWRFNHWEVKGVPLRIELGPKELQKRELCIAVRQTGEKCSMNWADNVAVEISTMLEKIQQSMYEKALAARNENMKQVTKWEDFVPLLNKRSIILSPWCGATECEDQVKKDSAEESKAAIAEDTREDSRAPSMGAKTLCIPFAQPGPVEGHQCICKDCTKPATTWVLFGRSF